MFFKKLFSQAGQDLWVIRDVFDFRTGGYFLDIGAADGIHFSNTYALEKYYSWKGLCVEPNPATFERLKKNRRCLCVQACIDSSPGEVWLDTGAGLHGGILPTQSHSGCKVPAMTLTELFRAKNVPPTIDYLSLDIEGAEGRVMETFPFATHRFLAATIERPDNALRRLLAKHGYILVADIPGLDAFYLHTDLCISYNIRSKIQGRRRALPWPQRLSEDIAWLMRHGIRSALRRI